MPGPLEAYDAAVARGALRPDPAQLEAARVLQRLYAALTGGAKRWFRQKVPPRGVYLWGGVGRGKSMLMDMFFAALPAYIPARRVHFHEFMIETHDALHRARQDGAGRDILPALARRVAKSSKVICFDEFHVTDIADAMILGRFFAALLAQGTVVVATSNWPPDKLYEGGLQRELFLPFIELVRQRLEIVAVDGDTDYRLQCLSDSGVYFAPLGLAAARNIEQVFSRLTGGAPVGSETLSVKGRNLTVEKTAKGVARFSFSQLCERPLGAEDYLTIARNYHTVFLEGVPRLKYDRRNEAKRLMTLIDALYDQRTKLVVSADAPPEKLYMGDDHAFEFQRTVSRLIEMQSPAYLAA